MSKRNRNEEREINQSTEQSNLIDTVLPIEEETIQIPKSKFKSQLCKVLYIDENKYGVSFQGYGISIATQSPLDKDKIGDFIEIKYESEIGQSDFKFYPIYK